MEPSVDSVLMERWDRRRDAEAFSEIVGRYAGLVYGTCRRVLGNASEAEDVAQECFAQLASAKPPSMPLGAWLHRLATCRSLDRVRSDARRARRERAYAESRGESAESQWDDVSAHVDAAIADLPDELRVPLVRHFLEGHSYSTLARSLGLSRTTLARRVQEGLEQVRGALSEKGVGVRGVALATMLARHAVDPVPASLTAALGKLTVAGAAPAAPLILGGTVVMAKKTGIALIVGALVVAVCVAVTPFLRRALLAPDKPDTAAQRASTGETPAVARVADDSSGKTPASPRQAEARVPDSAQMALFAALFQRFSQDRNSPKDGEQESASLTSKDLPEDNGAHYFLLAAELLPEIDGDWLAKMDDLIDANGWVDDPKLLALLESCRGSFDAIRQGLEVGNAMLPLTRGPEEPLPYLSKWRTLAKLMAMDGRMQAAHGEPAAAFDDYATMMEFANESARGGPAINGLVELALEGMAASVVHDTIPGSAASPEEYRAFAARLETLDASGHDLAQSVESEIENFESWVRESFVTPEQIRAFVLEPEMGFDEDGRRWAETASAAEVQAALQGVLDSYRVVLPYFELPYYEAQAVDLETVVGDNPMAQLLVAPFQGMPRTEARADASVSGAMIEVALEGYRAEHGSYPASLDGLVPGYFSRLPQDPFTGQPFGYSQAESDYTLYSAGVDMSDDGATLDDWDATGGDFVIHRPQ